MHLGINQQANESFEINSRTQLTNDRQLKELKDELIDLVCVSKCDLCVCALLVALKFSFNLTSMNECAVT